MLILTPGETVSLHFTVVEIDTSTRCFCGDELLAEFSRDLAGLSSWGPVGHANMGPAGGVDGNPDGICVYPGSKSG